jgi:hypothetical protein
MLTELKAQANAEAQKALHASHEYVFTHEGRRNPALDDAYTAAERVMDAIEELEKHLAVALQVADEEAPDYTADWLASVASGQYVTESEYRLLDGNR